MKKILQNLLKKLGYTIYKTDNACPDIVDTEFLQIYDLCKSYTMTSKERMFSLYQSVKYVLDNNIPGDFVECGVWKGGSAMLIAKYLQLKGIKDRKIYLYDTFEGMSAPTDNDKDFAGTSAATQLKNSKKEDQLSVWCYSGIDEVKKNLSKTGYPIENVHFVKGKVEETIPHTIPSAISLLRLDTDWYESTIHELIHLYPLLKQNGVLIIDDYGHWVGCKKAVDEYFAKENVKMLLHRIDYTGRVGIKV